MNNNLIYNPLNVEASTQQFIGEVTPSPHPGFKAFQSFAYGIRAAAKTIVTYYLKYKLNTVHDLISRWAPAADGNDTAAYIAEVCSRMGISEYETFKVNDPNELQLLVEAMSHEENQVEYSPDDLQYGILMALNLPLPATQTQA